MAREGLLAGICLLATLAGDPARADEATPQPIVLPPGNAVQLTVGGARRFSATVTAKNVEYRWTVDGERVGTGRAFEYVPDSRDIGAHEIAVTVLRGSAASRHVWRVTVEPPPVPRIVDVVPSTAVVESQPGARVAFRYVVTSSVPTDEVEVAWTVDGARAGEGTSFSFEVEAGAPKRVRAVASSALGVVQAREWRVVPAGPAVATGPSPDEIEPDEELSELLRTMRPEQGPRGTVAAARPTTTVQVAMVVTTSVPPAVTTTSIAPAVTTTSTTPILPTTSTIVVARAVTSTSTAPRVAPTTTQAPRAATTTTGVPRPATTTTVTPVAAPPSTVLAAVRAAPPSTLPRVPPPAPRGIAREEIVAFLERYARAYESRSVGELQRIGQISGAKQAEALGRYFEQVRDLQVDVRVLEIVPRGEVARIRYRRRDRFRDPTGRLVDKETPPIEKEIRRTPNGLVFTPSS